MATNRQQRRRDPGVAYAALTATIKPETLDRLTRIAALRFPNRSAAVERAIELLVAEFPKEAKGKGGNRGNV
jgi:hypothetical protein